VTIFCLPDVLSWSGLAPMSRSCSAGKV